MASWFYLYLYTEEPAINADNIEVTITKVSEFQKGIKKMSLIENGLNNLTIDEGTSHWLKAIVKDNDGNALDLTGCNAVFTMPGIDKQCIIIDNEVTVKLEPEETIGFLSSGYQIRIFDANDDVFQIIQGIIYIRKAHKPYIQNPLVGGE